MPARAPTFSRQEELTYEAFYGLHEKPFGLSPDPKFLYHSTSHDHVVQALIEAIQRHDGLTVVIGERGIGKTMLCRSFLEQLDRRTLTSLVSDPSISVEDLLKTVLVDVGVVSSDDLTRDPLMRASRRELTDTLRSFLSSLSALQASTVVIIDDAHRLGEDVLEHLRTLVDFKATAHLLDIVLVGRPSLVQTLRRSELRSLARAARPLALTPLQSDEVAGYVSHRIAVAGDSPRVEFDDAALKRLFEVSGGVPRVVNVIGDRALTIGHEASASVIDQHLIDAAAEKSHISPVASAGQRIVSAVAAGLLLALLILVGAIGAALVFRNQISLIVTQWEGVPPLPHSPAARVAVPLAPLPPPS